MPIEPQPEVAVKPESPGKVDISAPEDISSDTVAGVESRLPDKKVKKVIAHSISLRQGSQLAFPAASIEMLMSLTNETMGTHIHFQHDGISASSNSVSVSANDQHKYEQLSTTSGNDSNSSKV